LVTRKKGRDLNFPNRKGEEEDKPLQLLCNGPRRTRNGEFTFLPPKRKEPNSFHGERGKGGEGKNLRSGGRRHPERGTELHIGERRGLLGGKRGESSVRLRPNLGISKEGVFYRKDTVTEGGKARRRRISRKAIRYLPLEKRYAVYDRSGREGNWATKLRACMNQGGGHGLFLSGEKTADPLEKGGRILNRDRTWEKKKGWPVSHWGGPGFQK